MFGKARLRNHIEYLRENRKADKKMIDTLKARLKRFDRYDLEKAIKAAVEVEDYETAANLRDQLSELD